MKLPSNILTLPRRNRRALYLLPHRDDHRVTWAPYRRWDGGEPRIYAGIDALKAKDARKQAEKATRALGGIDKRVLTAAGAVAGFMVRKFADRRMFRRRKVV